MANISTLGQQVDNNSRLLTIQAQLNELQIQLASGKKANLFEGLGTDAIISQRSRTNVNQIDIYQSNITQGVARSKQMSQGVSEFIKQAQNVLNAMTNQEQQGNIDLTSLKQFAKDGVKYLRELINTKDGDRYLFAGSDAFVAPLEDTGAHGTYMEGLFQSWKDGTITTDQLISSYKATPDTTIGFSPSLSSGLARNVYVRADVNIDVDYTVFANNDGFKDVLNSIALLDKFDIDKIALEPDDNPLSVDTAPGSTPQAQKDNFFKLYEDMIKQMRGGLKKLDSENQKLQKVEVTLDNLSKNHADDKNTLLTAIGRVEDVDTTEVAVKISSLQIQLTAAYQVTAALGSLSLAKYF